jgi:hypothetical protein
MVRAQPAMRATPTMSPIMIPDMNPISSLDRSPGSRAAGGKGKDPRIDPRSKSY